MKKLLPLFIMLISAQFVSAQTDLTSKIVNPSFEDNVDSLAIGWTYSGGCDTYAWHTINTDADATKTGNNICGLWNATFGDATISQTITGLTNGIYKVTADLMGSSNASSTRLTTQRIFLNDKSVLFGADTAYSAKTIEILTDTLGEVITYANHTVTASDAGPLLICEVIDTITDGTITLGVKTNGSDSPHGFSFPSLTAGDGWGWFKVDNFTLTLMNSGSAINNTSNEDVKIIVNDGFLSVFGVENFKVYTTNGMLVNADKQLQAGIYILKSNSYTTKFIVR